jgi:hypothetical protein
MKRLNNKSLYEPLFFAGMLVLLGLLALFTGKAGQWWCPISGVQARAFGVAALLWALWIIFVTFRKRSRGE